VWNCVCRSEIAAAVLVACRTTTPATIWLTEKAAREEPGGEAVTTEVIDDGVGVAPEDVKRLTERFYRVDRSRSREQGGTGLGLAIAKHIPSAHGSELTVSSSLGHGSTFGFTLPVAPERGGAGERGEERTGERENGRKREGRSANERPERTEKAMR
jgi:light-regulated signal transduction histidine kinase (bacteriophytochrome)